MNLNLKINPELKMKSDIMFKAFFTRKENEEFLKEFLESVLGEKIKIKKVLHDVRLDQFTKNEKFGILDLGVELENGEFINIEIQLRDNHNIEKRTTFYASKKITEQLGAGEEFIKLKTVRVAEKHREYELNNDVKYYYIELSKFRKENPDMTQIINHWLSFIDMERGDLLEMASEKNEKIKKAIENYEVLTGDEEVKRLAELKQMAKFEEQSALQCAREEGKEEGREQGKKEKQIEIAKKLKEQKMPKKQIAEITELSEEEIETLEK